MKNEQEEEGLKYSISSYSQSWKDFNENLKNKTCGARLEPFVRPSEWDGSDVSIKCDAVDRHRCATRIMTGMWLIKGEQCKYRK